jgi:hypothetical protein
VCILLGCGIPTTANYIIMVTVAAPTLVQLGVEPLVAHFFVFYYGVLADITPPVALAAYAAAGMAGSDPFKTGNMAFRLGMAKALVPFVFVFSPSLLIVAKGFTWYDFASPSSAACSASPCWRRRCRKFFLVEMKRAEQMLCVAWRAAADRARPGCAETRSSALSQAPDPCPPRPSPAAASGAPTTTPPPANSTCTGTTRPCSPTGRYPRKSFAGSAAPRTRRATGKTALPTSTPRPRP